jgi:hypothetical protein
LGDDTTDVHAWFRDHWANRNEPALAFFHRWSLDAEATLEQWLEGHENALRDRRVGLARAMLLDWSEISLDDLDRQRLGDLLWARTHHALGLSLWETPIAPRAPSVNAAIAHYEATLRVYTESDYPADWATTQNNLGIAYGDLPTGDRVENLRCAIACCEAALRVRTEADFPADWATTLHGRSRSYRPVRWQFSLLVAVAGAGVHRVDRVDAPGLS